MITRAGIAGLVLVSMRGLGPGFALVALVAAALVAVPDRIRTVFTRRDTQVWSAVVLVGVAATVVWTFVVGLKLDQPEHPAVGFADAFHTLPVIVRQSIGAMGTNFLPLPVLLLAAWAVIALVAIAVGLIDASTRGRVAIGLVALATIALPITTDGYNVPSIGFPWQGRYGLPLTVGLVILACWLVDATTARRHAIGIGLAAVAFTGQVVAFVAIGRRLGMGRVQGADVLDWVVRPRWEPGLPPGLLLAGMVLAAGGLLALGVHAMSDRPPRPAAAVAPSHPRHNRPRIISARWTGGSIRISRRTGTSAPSTGMHATRPPRRSRVPKIDWFCAELGIGADATLLDVGAGTGMFTYRWAQRLPSVTGLELSENMIERSAFPSSSRSATPTPSPSPTTASTSCSRQACSTISTGPSTPSPRCGASRDEVWRSASRTAITHRWRHSASSRRCVAACSTTRATRCAGSPRTPASRSGTCGSTATSTRTGLRPRRCRSHRSSRPFSPAGRTSSSRPRPDPTPAFTAR